MVHLQWYMLCNRERRKHCGRLPPGCPGNHDPGHHFVLRGVLRVHPAALPSQSGREICLHGRHPAPVLTLRYGWSVDLHRSAWKLPEREPEEGELRLLLRPGLDRLPADADQRADVFNPEETQIMRNASTSPDGLPLQHATAACSCSLHAPRPREYILYILIFLCIVKKKPK